jgi:nucleotide-binding universal stress UspA family protein
VVGSRGLTPLAAVLLGSTAERLGGRCRQPLLVDRPKGAHHGLFTAILR